MNIRLDKVAPDVAGKRAGIAKNGSTRIEPGFFIISVYGQTYLVAADTRNEAVAVLAETRCLATDPGDWTTMRDDMFAEITPTHQLRGQILTRDQYLDLCRHKKGYVDAVELRART